MRNRIFQYLISLIVSVLLQSCTNIGPNSIPHDQFDYNTAISKSWREQTLLNIVKLRYADFPVFVEVASVVSGYTFESSINMGASVEPNADIYNLGGTGKYIDRPTITYVPLTGDKFNRNMMSPIPPSEVMFLLMMGYSAQTVIPISVDVINGWRSQRSGGANLRQGDDEYYRIVELLTEIQRSGSISLGVKQTGNKKSTMVMLSKKRISKDLANIQREFKNILGLGEEKTEFDLVFGELPTSNHEVAIMTRSVLQIMIELATQINVPKEHVEQGLTVATVYDEGKNVARPKQINIKVSASKPDHAHTAVFYQDHWFWVDNRDFKSKRTFAYLMILFSLTESGPKEGLPLITIPAG